MIEEVKNLGFWVLIDLVPSVWDFCRALYLIVVRLSVNPSDIPIALLSAKRID